MLPLFPFKVRPHNSVLLVDELITLPLVIEVGGYSWEVSEVLILPDDILANYLYLFNSTPSSEEGELFTYNHIVWVNSEEGIYYRAALASGTTCIQYSGEWQLVNGQAMYLEYSPNTKEQVFNRVTDSLAAENYLELEVPSIQVTVGGFYLDFYINKMLEPL